MVNLVYEYKWGAIRNHTCLNLAYDWEICLTWGIEIKKIKSNISIPMTNPQYSLC